MEKHMASERTNYVMFLTYCFQSLESEKIRSVVLKLVSLPLWHHLSAGRLQVHIHSLSRHLLS